MTLCRSVCLPSCGGVRPNRASPCAEGVGVAVPRRSTIERLRSGASGPATIPLRKGRSACGGVLRHGGTFARCGSRHLSTPPPPIHLSPRCAIHPRMRLAWLGRNTSRHPARPPRGACRTRAADSLWPRSSPASPRPLFAIPILSRRAGRALCRLRRRLSG